MLQILKTFCPFHLFRNYHFVCTICAGNLQLIWWNKKKTLFKKQGVHRIHLMGTCGSTALPQNDTMYCGQDYDFKWPVLRERQLTFGPIMTPKKVSTEETGNYFCAPHNAFRALFRSCRVFILQLTENFCVQNEAKIKIS